VSEARPSGEGHLSDKEPSLNVGRWGRKVALPYGWASDAVGDNKKTKTVAGPSHATVSEGRRFGRRSGGCQEEICELSFGPER